MAGPMESPRTTFALGPLEVSFRRRDDNVRLGVLGSLVVHVLVILLLTVVVPNRKTVVAEVAPGEVADSDLFRRSVAETT